MMNAIIYVSVALVTVCYLSDWLFSVWDGPGAPPRAKPRIPLIGHALGFFKLGGSYFTMVGAQQNSDVYTMDIFNFKIYVINSRRLIPLVQRLSKTLSFTPFMQFAAKVYMECSTYTVDLHANPDFTRDISRVMKESMSPGPHLDYQNLRATNSLKDMLEELFSRNSAESLVELRLHEWIKHVITVAATDGVYGTSNPFLDKQAEEAFWTWNDGMPALVAGMGVFVPKVVKARQYLVDAFKKHHHRDYSDAAQVTKERIRVMQEYGVQEDDLARMQLSFNIALLPNSVPTAFWTIFNAFSRPELLQKLRTELTENAVSCDETDQHIELDVVAVKTRCPTLLAVFEETQRTLTVHANIRKVQEDTILDSFHLKKGSYLQMPNQPIHFSEDVWGDDPTVFNPDRFFKDDDSSLRSSLPSNSFLAWGAAPHLCPARQFASTEILVLAALLILRTDMQPVGGHWRRPKPKIGSLTTILPPLEEVEVKMKPRDGWNRNWILKMGESRSKVPLASG